MTISMFLVVREGTRTAAYPGAILVIGLVAIAWSSYWLRYARRTGRILGYLLRMEQRGTWRYEYLVVAYVLGLIAGIALVLDGLTGGALLRG